MKRNYYFYSMGIYIKIISLHLYLFLPMNLSGQVTHSIQFSNTGVTVTSITASDNNQYEKIILKNSSGFYEEGRPILPFKTIQLIIPCDQKVSTVSVVIKSQEDIKIANKILPAQLTTSNFDDTSKSEFTALDSKVYNSDQPWPSNIVEVVNDGYFDGNNHIVNVRVCPFQYNPKSNKLVLITSLDFTLNLSGSSGAKLHNIKNRKAINQKRYDNILAKMVGNPQDISKYKPKQSSQKTLSKTLSITSTLPFYEYVIITNNALKSSFNEFIEWKKRKGLNVGIVTTDSIYIAYPNGDPNNSSMNDNAGKIRAYLKDAWLNGTKL